MWCCDKCEILFNLEQLYKINFDYLLVDHPDDKKSQWFYLKSNTLKQK